jgi:hypothetical protein
LENVALDTFVSVSDNVRQEAVQKGLKLKKKLKNRLEILMNVLAEYRMIMEMAELML